MPLQELPKKWQFRLAMLDNPALLAKWQQASQTAATEKIIHWIHEVG